MSLRKEKRLREPGERRAGFWRCVCWCGLVALQVGVIHELDTKAATAGMELAAVEAEQPLHGLEVRSEWYASEEDCEIPSELYQSEDGTVYRLKRWETVQQVLPERLQTAEQEQVFEGVEGLAPVPEAAVFTVEEEGRTGTVRAKAVQMTVLREAWSSDFTFPVTFHSCDAEYCQLGDAQIPCGEEQPEFAGQEHLLLDLIGAPQDEYRVTAVRWDGEVYLDEAGIPCRNAVASGEKLLRDYRVLYRGTARFPEVVRWQTAAEYELLEEETPARRRAPSVTVLEEPVADDSGNGETEPAFWKKIIRTMRLVFSLLISFLLILVMILAKKRRAWYTDDKIAGSGCAEQSGVSKRKRKPHRRNRNR